MVKHSKVLLFFIVWLASLVSYSQEVNLDSLVRRLAVTKNDSNKVNLLYTIGKNYLNSDLDKALQFSTKSLQIADSLKFDKGKANALKILGSIFEKRGDYPRALENQFASLKLMESLKDKLGIAKLLTNIGNTYYDEKEFGKAIGYYEKSIAILDNLKMTFTGTYINSLLGAGAALEGSKDYNRALMYCYRIIEIGKSINDQEAIGYAYNNMGSIYKSYKINYTKSLDYFEKALIIRNQFGNSFDIASTLMNIGSIYSLQKDYPKALNYLHKALKIAKENQELSLVRETEFILNDLYEDIHDTPNAYIHYKAYIAAKDSEYNIEKIKKIANLESKLKEDKMTANFEREQIKKEADLKRQKIVTSFFVVGFCVVMLLIFFVYNNLKKSRHQTKIIAEQKLQVELHQQEMLDSITYAKRLQQAILPPYIEIQKQLPESFIYYQPKDIVAGDFYWMHNNGSITYIAAADCTGHGVPGAIVSVVCSNALNRAVNEFALTNTGAILDKTRQLVIETFERSGESINDGMDISLLAINASAESIQWSGANNPLWLIEATDNGMREVKEIKADKQPIGNSEHQKPYASHNLPYIIGSKFYLITDGYADQFGANDKKLMKKKFKELILSIHNKPMQAQGSFLKQFHEEWKGDTVQTDDITVIGIQV